jgi:hypothetical protein
MKAPFVDNKINRNSFIPISGGKTHRASAVCAFLTLTRPRPDEERFCFRSPWQFINNSLVDPLESTLCRQIKPDTCVKSLLTSTHLRPRYCDGIEVCGRQERWPQPDLSGHWMMIEASRGTQRAITVNSRTNISQPLPLEKVRVQRDFSSS